MTDQSRQDLIRDPAWLRTEPSPRLGLRSVAVPCPRWRACSALVCGLLALGCAVVETGCARAPRYSDQKVDCVVDANCTSLGKAFYCAEGGLCVRDPDAECAQDADCTEAVAGAVPCKTGRYRCEQRRCNLYCEGCTEDLDHDGFGKGDGCAGLDCDDTTETLTGEAHSRCYEGPPETEGVGSCRGGSRWCSGGLWGSCSAQVLPALETCDGQDEDCDGAIDAPLVMPSCGIGACTVTASCKAKRAFQCVPKAPGPEGDTPNGVDDDCNGVVDDLFPDTGLPPCVFVAPGGDDTYDGLSPASAVASPSQGFQIATQALAKGKSLLVCLASGPDCGSQSSYYVDVSTEALKMANGVSMMGGFETTAWTQCPRSGTILVLQGQQPLLFGPDITLPTSLSNLILKRTRAGQTAVRVDGASAVSLRKLSIPASKQGGATALGLEIINGASVTLSESFIVGGPATDTSVGIAVDGAVLTMDSVCPELGRAADGSCQQSCSGDSQLGVHALPPGPGPAPAEAIGILLNDAAGSRITNSAICDVQADKAWGVVVTGDATGLSITGSMIEASGGPPSVAGVAFSCSAGSPELAYNGSVDATALANNLSLPGGVVAVDVSHGCAARIHDNSNLQVTVLSGGFDFSAGVTCENVKDDPYNPTTFGSPCGVSRNSINLVEAPFTPVRETFGIACGRHACARLEDNAIYVGTPDNAAAFRAGIRLNPGSAPLVRGNVVITGCSDDVILSDDSFVTGQGSFGFSSLDSGARVENNLLFGGNCVFSTKLVAVGAYLSLTDPRYEVDLNSNYLDGQGEGGYSVALAFGGQTGGVLSRGLVRNNILRSGDGGIGAGILRAGGVDLRAVHHNWIWISGASSQDHVLYRDVSGGGDTTLLDVTALQALGGFGENFDQRDGNPDPMLGGLTLGVRRPKLAEDSPCIDAGSPEGAPVVDFEGQARSDGKPDIGPDER